jgi:GNAT superfamily N-acetyltransferase
MERDNVFYMANSGVVETHRRRGIYTSLLKAVLQHAAGEGAWAVRSKHSVINRPVIIAKLREGFNISGLSQSARMGTLVELTLHLTGEHEHLYRQRVLPYRG